MLNWDIPTTLEVLGKAMKDAISVPKMLIAGNGWAECNFVARYLQHPRLPTPLSSIIMFLSLAQKAVASFGSLFAKTSC